MADWIPCPVMRINVPDQILAGTEIRQVKGRASPASSPCTVENIGNECGFSARRTQGKDRVERDRLICREADPVSHADADGRNGGDNCSQTGTFK